MAKQTKAPKSKARKITSWIFYSVFGLLFAGFIAMQISGLVTKKSNYGVPKYAGYQFNLVLTDSMEPEYKVGSILVVKETKASLLKEGDDITFYYKKWENYFNTAPIVTHRIREIHENPDVEIGKGHYTFIVGGINTESKSSPDIPEGETGNCLDQHQEVTEQYILGKVVSNSYAVGQAYQFISSKWGLLILLIIPTLYITATSVLDLFKAIKEPEEEDEKVEEKKETSQSEILNSLSKEEIEKLKKEMIEEMMKGKEDEKSK